VPLLLDEGHYITVVDLLLFGNNLPEHPNLKVIQADTRYLFPTEPYAGPYDVVFDLAAVSNDPAGELDPKITYEVNHIARVRTARLAKDSGAKRYIFPSSAAVYGHADGLLDETSPVNPLTTYAKANYAAEQDILQLNGGGFEVVVARQATVFGLSPRMRWDLVLNAMVRDFFRYECLTVQGDGSQIRPLIHVQDVAQALIFLMERGEPGQTYNVGTGNYSMSQLAREVARTLHPVPIPIEYKFHNPDKRSYNVSFDKLYALGYRSEWSIVDGAIGVYAALRDRRVDPNLPTTLEIYKKVLK
jgi:nucleoside-diphosphate-sugar epimerase